MKENLKQKLEYSTNGGIWVGNNFISYLVTFFQKGDVNPLNEQSIMKLIDDAVDYRFKSLSQNEAKEILEINLYETFGDVLIRSMMIGAARKGEIINGKTIRSTAREIEIGKLKRDLMIFKKLRLGSEDPITISGKILGICENIVKKHEQFFKNQN